MPRRPGGDEWKALLDDYAQSGLQQKEFCAKHDLPFSTFQYWLYRRSKRKSGSASELSASFMPIDVVASAAPEAREQGTLEVSLAGGHVLRFTAGVDPSYVAGLLRALR